MGVDLLDGDGVQVVCRPGRLGGELRVPGDKSVSHRALILNAMAFGAARVSGLSDGADVGVYDGLFAGDGGGNRGGGCGGGVGGRGARAGSGGAGGCAGCGE